MLHQADLEGADKAGQPAVGRALGHSWVPAMHRPSDILSEL